MHLAAECQVVGPGAPTGPRRARSSMTRSKSAPDTVFQLQNTVRLSGLVSQSRSRLPQKAELMVDMQDKRGGSTGVSPVSPVVRLSLSPHLPL